MMAERRASRLLSHSGFKVAVAVLSLWCAAPSGCGGGGGSSSVDGNPADPKQVDPGSIANAFLTPADVTTIVQQAANEAAARGRPATIAVVDRVGNVLTVIQMAGAPTVFTITDNDVAGNRAPGTGLLNQTIIPPNFLPTGYAAIAKAISGAYLSSNGNAFSTRTANQIVQEHFNPGVSETPGGPLFGVQFSQLACSDFNQPPALAAGTSFGPHSSPLGFSADSGGLPIYKNGVLVGGLGVMTKNTYSLNPNVLKLEINDDEEVAIAGVTGYEAPSQIIASTIAVGGIALRYQDGGPAQLAAPVSAAGTFPPVIAVPNYFVPPAAGNSYTGVPYGSVASGAVKDGVLTGGTRLYPNTTLPAYVFTTDGGTVAYPPTAGSAPADGNAITVEEARALETSGLNVAFSARAAIRNPTNSFAQVTVTVVDLDGNVLAQARTPDAPIFGSDVSRQKARSAVFFSRSGTLNAQNQINGITAASPSQPGLTPTGTFADYITAAKAQVNPQVFTDGIAWSEVAVGDISRPFYPDGINNADLNNPNVVLNTTPGSLSLTFNKWSIFSTGLQLDLVAQDIVNGILGATPAARRPPQGCGFIGGTGLPALVAGAAQTAATPAVNTPGRTALANGLQIFSGGYPVYRMVNGNPVLVGGIGISGDGIQQDSMISFLGIKNGPSTLINAPPNIRVDTLQIQGILPRYANCPANPFLNQVVGNPCDGF